MSFKLKGFHSCSPKQFYPFCFHCRNVIAAHKQLTHRGKSPFLAFQSDHPHLHVGSKTEPGSRVPHKRSLKGRAGTQETGIPQNLGFIMVSLASLQLVSVTVCACWFLRIVVSYNSIPSFGNNLWPAKCQLLNQSIGIWFRFCSLSLFSFPSVSYPFVIYLSPHLSAVIYSYKSATAIQSLCKGINNTYFQNNHHLKQQKCHTPEKKNLLPLPNHSWWHIQSYLLSQQPEEPETASVFLWVHNGRFSCAFFCQMILK